MPRRTADQRHLATAPPDTDRPRPATTGSALIEALVALHHPTRRMLYEALHLHGPARVGSLAARCGLAVGSVSHHLGVLHRNGFVEPAPELAADTRESWWRAVTRRLSWDVIGFAEGTAARQVAETAEEANFAWHTRARAQWMRERGDLPKPWCDLGDSSDALVNATPEQLVELGRQLEELVRGWSEECLQDLEEHPDAVRRPVRAITACFPSGPVLR